MDRINHGGRNDKHIYEEFYLASRKDGTFNCTQCAKNFTYY